MRNAFIETLVDLAHTHSHLMLVTADLGYGLFDQFRHQFPRQFLNVGVAEQNMLGVATGLALEGHIVFCYSLANFPTLRCLEQIRNDACYHQANVKIVASGGGLSYGSQGISHHATEDLAILRTLPNMQVIAPCDKSEASAATCALFHTQGPGYLRLERNASPINLAETDLIFKPGCARVLRQGRDITFITTGSIAEEAMQASNMLAAAGISARVLSMHTIKPLDQTAIAAAAHETGGIISIEEHTVVGGLGGAIAEICMDNQLPVKRFLRIGLRDTFAAIVGSQQFLRNKYGLDASTITQQTLTLLSKVPEYGRTESNAH